MKPTVEFHDQYVRGPHLWYFLAAIFIAFGIAILLTTGMIMFVTAFR